MKRLLIFLLLALLMTEAFPQRIGVGFGIGKKRQTKQASVQNYPTAYPGTEYYVSTSGNDSNNGLSPATAWKTLNKVNVQSFSAGDAILLNSVDTFAGTITVPTSGNSTNPITVSAYGPVTSKPLISGFTKVTGWTKRSNTSVYKKYIPMGTAPEIVTLNGVQMAMGRTPNSYRYSPTYNDYYHIDSFTGTTSITDSECNSATTNWTGAELVVRTSNHMNWARCAITGHSSTTLTITNSLIVAAGYGYFIQNDLRTLDQTGEWYFNNTTDTLYMYFAGNNPDSYTVKVSTNNTLIDVTNRDYITLKNIKFEGANQNAVETNSGSYANNLTVEYCDFVFNNRGVYGNSSPELTVRYCTFTNQSFMAMYNHWDVDGAYIAYNTIDSTGLVLGCGAGEGSWYFGTAIYSCYGHHTYSSKNQIIEYNSIKNSGYIGVTFGSDSAKVRYNYVDKYNLRKSDGGGIYYGIPEAYPHVNQLIDHNIVLNGNTQTELYGMPLNTITYACYNIYLDNNSNGGFTITNNTAAHTKGGGLMVHMSEDVIIKNNTFYDCETGVKFQEQSGYAPSSIREIDMQNNIIVSKKSNQKTISARSLANDFNLFGTINNNTYARPYDLNPQFITMVNTWAETANTFSAYKTATTWDAASTVSSIQIQNDDSIRFYTNPTNAAVTYALNATHVDAAGTTYASSVTVPAYSSKVLWKNDLIPYTAKLLGTQTVGGSATNITTRTAMPVTFTEAGQIVSVVLYHGGQLASGGSMLLGVYDNTGSSGLPGTKLGESNTNETLSYAGWQRINLKSPISVNNGQTVWLAWIFEKQPQLYYTAGTPGRAGTTGTTWSQALPSTFGTSTQAGSIYSIYCIYK